MFLVFAKAWKRTSYRYDSMWHASNCAIGNFAKQCVSHTIATDGAPLRPTIHESAASASPSSR